MIKTEGGWKHTEKERLKMSEKRKQRSGENAPNYRGKGWGTLKYRQAYRKEKREMYKELLRKWRKNNPEANRQHAKASAAKRNSGGKLTKQTVQAVYEDNIKKYGTLTCYLCEERIEFGNDHLEHKTPLSRGGTNDYDNLAVACKFCNLSKNAKTEEEYRAIKEQT